MQMSVLNFRREKLVTLQMFSTMFIIVLFTWVFHTNATHHFSCDNNAYGKCFNENHTEINFLKSDSTDYDKCPDSISCYEVGSTVHLNTSKNHGLYLENTSVLSLAANASLMVLNESGYCEIAGRSYLMVYKLLKVDSSHFSVYTSSAVINYGDIELIGESRLQIFTFSFLQLSSTSRLFLGRNSRLNVYIHSSLEFSYSSAVEVKRGEEIILADNSSLDISLYSVVKISSQGRMTLGFRSELSVDTHSSLEILYSTPEALTYGQIILGEQSSYHVQSYSHVRVSQDGSVILGAKSYIGVFQQSALELFYQVSNAFELYDHQKQTIQVLKMNYNSELYLREFSTLRLLKGKLSVMEGGRLDIYSHGRLELNGYLQIAEGRVLLLKDHAQLYVGLRSDKYEDIFSGNSTASLVIQSDGSGLIVNEKSTLTLKSGSHCLLTKHFVVENDTEVDECTKNEAFECFNNEKDLLKALAENESDSEFETGST